MNWRDKKCLVTGGASFIGSHLVESLVQLNVNVRVVDDLSSGKLENLEYVKHKIEFINGNLKNINTAQKASKNCDYIFHLAANHGGRGYISSHPASCTTNMALDNIVFETAHANQVEKIIFASSACVYPTDTQAEKRLLSEDLVSFKSRGGAFADEEYGWAKLMGELSLQAYHKQYGLKAASARISTAYGPRENESHALVALIAKAFIGQSPFEIWGNGEQTRGFTYVQDIVDGLILMAEHVDDASALNLGSSDFISLNQISNEIFKTLNWFPKDGIHHQLHKPVGVLHRALDGQKSLKKLGWKSKVNLEEGIKKTIDWYFSNNDPEVVKTKLETLLMQR